MSRARIVLLSAWASMGVALVPGAATADCTGITAGDFTFFSCTDGTSFTEQRIGHITYLSGDVTGWGQQIGNVEYWHVTPSQPALPALPGAPGLQPGAGWPGLEWGGWE